MPVLFKICFLEFARSMFGVANKMTFWEHLAELKICIMNIVLSVGTWSLFFFLFGYKKGDLLGHEIYYPFPDMTNNVANQFFLRIKQDLLPTELELFPQRLIDPILINVQISLYLGIILSTPWIYYHIGKFVSPGLYPKEKRMLKLVTIPATFLFILGCLFAYFLLIPFLIDFMYGYIESMETLPIVSIGDFINFVLLMTIAFGIIFELPIFMIGFTKIGLVNSDFWKKHWRIAVIIMLLVGALITPDGSGITMMIVALPMMALYFIGYLGSKYVQAKKIKKP